MSDSESSVFLFEGDEPAIVRAAVRAQETFRFFWRECSWEQRRIVPGLVISAVKVAFRDEAPQPAEHMWVGDVTFDGIQIRGTLLNQPNWVRSVSQGDAVSAPFSSIGDWMYAYAGDTVCGAFTVNWMRANMSPDERRQHDAMWGLEFGDPEHIQLVPSSGAADPFVEHPMSANMVGPWNEQLATASIHPFMEPDSTGWTLLHHLALAGSAATVKLLLEHGADASVRTHDGRTALDIAKSMGWPAVVALLEG